MYLPAEKTCQFFRPTLASAVDSLFCHHPERSRGEPIIMSTRQQRQQQQEPSAGAFDAAANSTTASADDNNNDNNHRSNKSKPLPKMAIFLLFLPSLIFNVGTMNSSLSKSTMSTSDEQEAFPDYPTEAYRQNPTDKTKRTTAAAAAATRYNA